MNLGIRLRRTILFFPADRPDRWPKALASGADAVCIDLEDAVAPNAKAEARAAALELLRTREAGRAETVLRVNSPRTPEGLRDLLALCDSDAVPDALMLPKVDSPDEVRWIEALLGAPYAEVRLIPMVETARGLAAAEAIAAASARVAAVLLGGVDLSAELGCSRDADAMLYARSRVVHAAALAGVDAIDMPAVDVADADALAADARTAARLGFVGKAAIHPAQVERIHAAFSPGEDEVRKAERVVAAHENSGGAVLLLDGRLVERPVVRAAQRTVAAARAAVAEE